MKYPNYTATECIEIEKKFYQECADKLNKSFGPILDKMLGEMLEIARKHATN